MTVAQTVVVVESFLSRDSAREETAKVWMQKLIRVSSASLGIGRSADFD